MPRSTRDALGISYNEVVAVLQSEDLDKLVASWKELLADLGTALTRVEANVCWMPGDLFLNSATADGGRCTRGFR
jgi:hypothetical protein